MTLGRNDERYRLPHRLLRSVTEHPLGPLVPIGNDPIQVLADNGVVRRFDNRSQSAGPQFRGVMLGDVPENRSEERRVGTAWRWRGEKDGVEAGRRGGERCW